MARTTTPTSRVAADGCGRGSADGSKDVAKPPKVDETPLESPPADDRRAGLSGQVLALYRQSATTSGDGLVAYPGERELAQRLGVTRHAVRNALTSLQSRGLIYRVPKRGTFMPSIAASSTVPPTSPIRCINFVHRPGLASREASWRLREYLAGYTEVLDLYDTKTRFVFCGDGPQGYTGLLWQQVPPKEQACLLIDLRVPELLRWLTERGIPYVVQNHRAYDTHTMPAHHRVYVNKVGGAFEATRRLIELGHSRIGFMGSTSEAEYEGFVAAIRCAGLTPRSQDVVDLRGISMETRTLAASHCAQLLIRADRPTAVVAHNGAILIALSEAAAKGGWRVPEDLSLIGFDNAVTPVQPRLGTIAVPRRELAHAAVELLLAVVRDRPLSPEVRVLQCTVDPRESVSSPSDGRVG